MKRLLTRLVAAALLVGLLAACSAPPTQTHVNVRLEPTANLGYEVDDKGKITVDARNARFSTPAGASAVTLTGYQVSYYDEAGNFLAGAGTEFNAISVFVPAGFSCTEPDERLGCTTTSPGAVAGPGQETPDDGLAMQLLNIDVIAEHIRQGQPSGWVAEVAFTGTGANGTFNDVFHFDIVAPN